MIARRRYVVGFGWGSAGNVLLIEKNKPAWQKGLLNGVGGKIEGAEQPQAAMIREFFEETGGRAESWRPFAEATGVDPDGVPWTVYFFEGRVQGPVRSTTSEEIAFYSIQRLRESGGRRTLNNLPWLIEIARDPNRPYVMIRYPKADPAEIQRPKS